MKFEEGVFGRLNSVTKYPSIPTFHTLGDKGVLKEEYVLFEGRVIGTEKVDGTNARIILATDGDYLIGSREELLYARGDRIGNPALGIVVALKATAERLSQTHRPTANLTIFFVEVFGGKITKASSAYTGQGCVAFRLFDVATISNPEEIAGWAPERISGWRESGGQNFLSVDELTSLAEALGLAVVPSVFDGDAVTLPQSLVETAAWLCQQLPSSLAALDSSASRQPEGVVLRTADRAVIAKARFEDYRRTLKNR